MLDSGFMRGNYLRRLPLYLLIDCSSSMNGDRIEAVNRGVELLYSALMSEAQAVETVFISVICFADSAEQEELIPISEFVPPLLESGGECALGAGLHLLVDSLQEDLYENTESRKGDYRPMAFVLLGSTPSDDWRSELDQLKRLSTRQQPTIVVLACTDEVDISVLSALTPFAYRLRSVNAENIPSFFRWLSASVISNSNTIAEQGGVRTAFTLPSDLEGSVVAATSSPTR